MMAVVKDRPTLRKYLPALGQIRELAESCARQLTGWAASVEKLPFEGQRRLPAKIKRTRDTVQKAQDFRLRFLATLRPEHPLYNTPEAVAARASYKA